MSLEFIFLVPYFQAKRKNKRAEKEIKESIKNKLSNSDQVL